MYWPGLSQATYYRDDWYYTLDRLKGGPQAFHMMFNIDRPIRGYLFEFYYRWFGGQPGPYHWSSYIWRLLTGLVALWLFRRVWPSQKQAALFMALLFILYPGYLQWMESFEDQHKVISLFCQVLSIVLTLEAIRSRRTVARLALWTGSILTGWIYIALVDYAIGLELFRLLCIWMLVNRPAEHSPWRQQVLETVRQGAVALIIPAFFLFWRLLIFNNTRGDTDVALQLSYLVSAPLLTGFWHLARLLQSTVNTALLAWGAPLFQYFFDLRLRQVIVGLAAAAAVGVLTFGVGWLPTSGLLDSSIESGDSQSRVKFEPRWQDLAIWIGLICVIVGVLPVVLANRYAEFDRYSHYALPASLAAAPLVVGLIYSLKSRHLRLVILSILVALAALTHYTVAFRVLDEEAITNAFWQQAAWRIPGLRAGTTLVVSYPNVDFGEDIDLVTGPANFIYHSGPVDELPVKYPLYAVPQSPWTSKDILVGVNTPRGYRTHIGDIQYDNLLVLAQSSENSCLRAVNAEWPWYSYQDQDYILLSGKYSRIDNIQAKGASPYLDEAIFGPEPVHGWCYYFEKAELAIQDGDWQRAADLGDEAHSLELHASDRIEWMPFLQAYAYLGDMAGFEIAADPIIYTPFQQMQACRVLEAMQQRGYVFNDAIQERIDALICSVKNQ